MPAIYSAKRQNLLILNICKFIWNPRILTLNFWADFFVFVRTNRTILINSDHSSIGSAILLIAYLRIYNLTNCLFRPNPRTAYNCAIEIATVFLICPYPMNADYVKTRNILGLAKTANRIEATAIYLYANLCRAHKFSFLLCFLIFLTLAFLFAPLKTLTMWGACAERIISPSPRSIQKMYENIPMQKLHTPNIHASTPIIKKMIVIGDEGNPLTLSLCVASTGCLLFQCAGCL